MRTLVATLVILLAGCGASGYRVVYSAHEVELSEQLALAPISGQPDDDHSTLSAIDDGLARGLAASAPGHVFARGGEPRPFTLSVALSNVEAREGRTLIASEVTVVDRSGTVVDELAVSFENIGDGFAAGEELGRRIGHYLDHREGYHL